MKKYIVTGGAGFIGSHLVKALTQAGHEVRVVDNRAPDKKIDVRNYEDLLDIFKRAYGVFHLAAISSVPFSIEQPKESHDNNVTGTLNVLAAAKEAGVQKVVYASSSAVYGGSNKVPQHEKLTPQPQSPYALHKYIGEQYCNLFYNLFGLPAVSLRYFNVYGPGMSDSGPYASVIKTFLKQKAFGKPLTITGDGRQTRDFVFVDDVVRATMLAMEQDSAGRGEVINIGSGKSYSINTLAAIIGGPGKHIEPREEPRDSLADISKARELLGWSPSVALADGLSQLIASL